MAAAAELAVLGLPATAQDPRIAEQKRRDLEEDFRDLEPQRQLNEEQAAALRDEVSRAPRPASWWTGLRAATPHLQRGLQTHLSRIIRVIRKA